MTKYKVVGAVNFIFGSLQVIYPLLMAFMTVPKLMQLYSEFSVGKPSLAPTYLALGFNLLLGVMNIFFAFKLFSKQKAVQEKYFKFGLGMAVASFLLLGVSSFLTVLSAVIPVYQMTSHF